jgi:hypothetical protein
MLVLSHILGPNEQGKTPDDGQRNCPKHVEFLTKHATRLNLHEYGDDVKGNLWYWICCIVVLGTVVLR